MKKRIEKKVGKKWAKKLAREGRVKIPGLGIIHLWGTSVTSFTLFPKLEAKMKRIVEKYSEQ